MDTLATLLADADFTPAKIDRLARELSDDHGRPVLDADGPHTLTLDCQLVSGVRIS